MNRTVIGIVVQMLCLAGLSQAPAAPASSPEQELFKLLNAERESAQLEKLQWDENVAQAAQAHAERLAANRILAHKFSGENELEQRVATTGARFSAVAENLAVAPNAEQAHMALMNSPGHRANILNPLYNVVGIAVSASGNDLYVTEDFAHAVPAYTEQQFREALVAAFNRARQAHRNRSIEPHFDKRLDKDACAGKSDPVEVLGKLEGAVRATVFTANEPGDLPDTMQSAAEDMTLRRMDLGVCFIPGTRTGFAQFRVIAAFYPDK